MKRSTLAIFLLLCLPARLSIASSLDNEATTQPVVEPGSMLSPQDKAIQSILDHRLPSIQLAGQSLSDSLDFFADVTGANMIVDWPALRAVGVSEKDKIHLERLNMAFGDALNVVLIQAAGTPKPAYRIEEGAIMVSTPAELDRFDLFKAYEADKFRELQKTEASDLSRQDELMCLNKTFRDFQLTAAPLTDAIDLMKDLGSLSNRRPLNIITDWEALKAAGIDKHVQVTILMHNLTAAANLQLILYQVGRGEIAFGDDRGVVFIATKEKLDAMKSASTSEPSPP